MHKFSWLFAAVLSFATWGATTVSAEVSAGVTITDDGVKSFYLAIGDHYTVPEKEIVIVRHKHIPDEELPVVFFLARRASVKPGVIISLRTSGKSWFEITAHFGLKSDIYYIDVHDAGGPPYGKAYGHWRNKPKKAWKKFKLSDGEIVNAVNLRFMSEYYGLSTGEIIRMREKGTSFVNVHKKVKHRAKEIREKKTRASVEKHVKSKKTSNEKVKSKRGKKK